MSRRFCQSSGCHVPLAPDNHSDICAQCRTEGPRVTSLKATPATMAPKRKRRFWTCPRCRQQCTPGHAHRCGEAA